MTGPSVADQYNNLSGHTRRTLRIFNKFSPLPGHNSVHPEMCCPPDNQWSKNSAERPHRILVTPRGGEWIRPTLISLLHGSLGQTL